VGEARLTVAHADPGLATLNRLARSDAEASLLRCCGARRWAGLMERMRPFHTRRALQEAASDVWRALTPADWLQAFASHPQIGDRGQVSTWSKQEQAGAAGADDDVLDQLAALNAEYQARFGYIFIICASGRSATGILAELERRIENSPADELREAAGEQERITELRLAKLLTELGAEG
jgi:2-oxo-4-hydroxy-4-carboxy-5-ureidoimidazoline decarboxylase